MRCLRTLALEARYTTFLHCRSIPLWTISFRLYQSKLWQDYKVIELSRSVRLARSGINSLHGRPAARLVPDDDSWIPGPSYPITITNGKEYNRIFFWQRIQQDLLSLDTRLLFLGRPSYTTLRIKCANVWFIIVEWQKRLEEKSIKLTSIPT
jgi:hypothetical protein